MIFDAQSGIRGVLVNVDSGLRIPFAFWADLQTGEWKALAATPDGRRKLSPRRVLRGCNRLQFIPAPPRPPAAASAAPLAELAKEVLKGRAIVAVPGQECEERLCHRLATWEVSHEQEVEPARAEGGRLFERAVATSVHRYCARHYRPPVFTSVRGVQSEVAVSARPQW
jgi:hypothetical protein